MVQSAWPTIIAKADQTAGPVNALNCILAPTAQDVRTTTNVEAASAGPVNVSRRRAIGNRAHRNKTVIAKRATAIARRDTVTTSAAREVRFGAAL